MPFIQHVSNLAKALMAGSAIRYTLFFALATLAFGVQALSPSQVFDKVKDSVIVVKTLDAKGEIIGQGSGVILPSGKIGTNCHVVKNGVSIQVGGGKQFVPATLWGSDEDKDICLLEASGLSGESAQLGQSSRLKVGEPVYAVGAPRGLELSLSDGIVSQLRGGPPPFIQTTAAISPGSSGGGLFDADGRLVGFTSLYIEGAQSLNFAMPVEWAGEIQPGRKAAQGRSWADWDKRTKALEAAKNWTDMRDWCQRWTEAQPGNIFAWIYLSTALGQLNSYTEAIEAARNAIKINPKSAVAWTNLGDTYRRPKRYAEAIAAYRQAIRLDPRDVTAWLHLGDAYSDLKRYTEAIEVYQQLVRIDPKDADLWELLALAYEESGNRIAASDVLRQLRGIDPGRAGEAIKAMASRGNLSSSAVAKWVLVGESASNGGFDIYADPATIRKFGNMVKMWDLSDYKMPQVVAGDRYLSQKTQYEYDCKEERYRRVFFSWHSENMGIGNVVYSSDGKPSNWMPTAPGSVAENNWKTACGKQ